MWVKEGRGNFLIQYCSNNKRTYYFNKFPFYTFVQINSKIHSPEYLKVKVLLTKNSLYKGVKC